MIEKVQEREAKDWLYVEQSKQNLQQDIPFPDVESEEVQESAHAETDPLVLEMQEHASELSRESGYAPDERFVVTMTGENFPDSKDAFAIWDYVKEEYYGYSDGKVQTFADYVSASEALQEIRGRNMEAEKEPATVQPEPAAPVQPDYRVGDTLYLDGKAFTIEKVGLFDVELRDPDSVYPIFRSESKENLARILGHEENVHLHNLVVDLNSGKEEAFRAGHEAKHAENYRINSFHLGEGSPKQKFRANMDAIYTLKALENQHRDATPEEQETLANYVGWGGLADAFDAEKTAWTGEYKELKAALTEEEYAAARASTLNAHYTSPTVIRAIYEALDSMGFEKGNILEPSMGVGNFFGMLPDSMLGSRLYGVELDSITGVLRKSCIRRQKSRWQALRPPTGVIFMIWPWAMCLLATTVSAISHMINSDFLSTTISLPRHWIRFGPVVSWPLLPAAIRWIPKIRTHESIWRSGQNCWGYPTSQQRIPCQCRYGCGVGYHFPAKERPSH